MTIPVDIAVLGSRAAAMIEEPGRTASTPVDLPNSFPTSAHRRAARRSAEAASFGSPAMVKPRPVAMLWLRRSLLERFQRPHPMAVQAEH